MGIGDRLKLVRGPLNQEDIAAAIKISTNTWGRYEREERPPDAEFLLLLRRKKGISPDWVLTGEGPQYVPAGVAEERTPYEVADGFVHLPLYKKVSAKAGTGNLVDPQAEKAVEMRAFSLEWIRHELRANPADLFLHHVEGDSMDDGQGDGLKAGSIVIVDGHDTATLKDGIYVLRLGDALMVKQLQRLPGDRLKVSSKNRAYEPFELDLKTHSHELQIIGRVLFGWSGRRF